jgi:hypothetical protein
MLEDLEERQAQLEEVALAAAEVAQVLFLKMMWLL